MATRRLEHVDRSLAEELAEEVFSAMGKRFRELTNRYGIDPADGFQFLPVSRRCAEARESMGLDIKEAATRAKIPQYRTRAVENGRFGEMTPEATAKYLALLGLGRWFRGWAKKNAALVERHNLTGACT